MAVDVESSIFESGYGQVGSATGQGQSDKRTGREAAEYEVIDWCTGEQFCIERVVDLHGVHGPVARKRKPLEDNLLVYINMVRRVSHPAQSFFAKAQAEPTNLNTSDVRNLPYFGASTSITTCMATVQIYTRETRCLTYGTNTPDRSLIRQRSQQCENIVHRTNELIYSRACTA